MDMILYSNRALCVDIIYISHHHVEAHALNGATNDALLLDNGWKLLVSTAAAYVRDSVSTNKERHTDGSNRSLEVTRCQGATFSHRERWRQRSES